jgi:hypothetical protein
LTALGGIAALVIGGGMLLEEASALFVPVIGAVGGIAAIALANHERLKQRIEALEKRLTQAEWRSLSLRVSDRGRVNPGSVVSGSIIFRVESTTKAGKRIGA